MVRKIYRILYVILIVNCTGLAQSTNNQSIDSQIRPLFEKLKQTAGHQLLDQVNLRIVDQKSVSFNPKEKTLYFGRYIFSILREEIPQDWEGGVAYLLGHEMAHAIFNHKEDLPPKLLRKQEEEADIYGSMLAYLANLLESPNIASEALRKIYDVLKLKEVDSYPHLITRLGAIESTKPTIEKLFWDFEMANYLILINEPILATYLYEDILEKVKLGEVQNNLGLAYLTAYLGHLELNKKLNFAYPILMAKGMNLRRTSSTEDPANSLYLAEKAFQEARRLSPDDPNPYLNYVILLLNYGLHQKHIIKSPRLDEIPRLLSQLEGQSTSYGDMSAKIQLLKNIYLLQSSQLNQKDFNRALVRISNSGISPSLKKIVHFNQGKPPIINHKSNPLVLSKVVDGINLNSRRLRSGEWDYTAIKSSNRGMVPARHTFRVDELQYSKVIQIKSSELGSDDKVLNFQIIEFECLEDEVLALNLNLDSSTSTKELISEFGVSTDVAYGKDIDYWLFLPRRVIFKVDKNGKLQGCILFRRL